jgi:hypothetical protein
VRPVTHRRGTTLAVLAAGTYAISFFLPTANHALIGNPVHYGGDAFLFCLRAIFNGEPNIGQVLASGWLANPAAWLAGVSFLAGHKWMVWPALAAVELGLCPLPLFWSMILGHPGYWIWLASLALLLGACMTRRLSAPPLPTASRPDRSGNR